MRVSAQMLATVLTFVGTQLQPGVTGLDIDELAATELKGLGGKPAFLNYYGFPGSHPGCLHWASDAPGLLVEPAVSSFQHPAGKAGGAYLFSHVAPGNGGWLLGFLLRLAANVPGFGNRGGGPGCSRIGHV